MQQNYFPHSLQAISEDSSRIIKLKRNEYLCKAGDYSTSIYMILDGAVRAYRLENDEEQCIRFGYKGSLMVSLDSYFGKRPTEFFIQALKNTEVSVIPKSHFDELIHADLEFKNGYLEMLENLTIQQMEREIDLLINNPMERYQRVLERSPALFQHIPLKYIASYLRMSPETLSRLRKS